MEHNGANEYRSLRFDSITIMQTERMWFFLHFILKVQDLRREKSVFKKFVLILR